MNKKIFSLRFLLSLVIITIGSVIAAAALELILIPNLMIDGGINGVSIILNTLFGGSLGIIVLILNIPFLILGFKRLGIKFLIKAGYAMGLFSCCLIIFEHFDALIDDTLLATIYGGILLGVGVGLIIKEGSCLDGTEIIAILVSKNNNFSIGQIVFAFNIIIYGVAIFVFGADRALYSLLTYFVTYKVIDMVADGLDIAKAVFIITDDGETISRQILQRLGRTVTVVNGEGIVSKDEKKVLYTVITRFEVSLLKDILKEVNASSFATVFDVSELIGNHIKKIPNNKKL